MLPKSCENNLFVAFTGVVNPSRIEAKSVLINEKILIENDKYKNYFNFENDCLIPLELLESHMDADMKEEHI